MKKTLAALALVSALTASHAALACSPPIPAYGQNHALTTVLNSEAYSTALAEQVKGNFQVRIQQVDFGRGVQIHLSNGCTIRGWLEYNAPDSNGMCPQFKGVKVETTCE